MDFGITGKRAAVAGASAGLGRATAAALIEAGVDVAICGRDRDRLRATASELGPLAHPIVADVSDRDGALFFVEEARNVLGGIDILVPNAGGPPPGTMQSTSLDAFAAALELSLMSTVTMCSAVVDGMVDAGWGRIVAITSISARQPLPNMILSNTARAGVTGFLKSLSLELAVRGVTVNSVQPGLHATDRLVQLNRGRMEDLGSSVPVGSLGRPQDFGAVVAFLCSQQASFITGAAIPVDGGAAAGLQ